MTFFIIYRKTKEGDNYLSNHILNIIIIIQLIINVGKKPEIASQTEPSGEIYTFAHVLLGFKSSVTLFGRNESRQKGLNQRIQPFIFFDLKEFYQTAIIPI